MSLQMPKSSDSLKFRANHTCLLWQMVKMILQWTLAWRKESQKQAYTKHVLSCDGVSEIRSADIELKSLWRALYHLPGTLRQKLLTLQLTCGHGVTSNTITHKFSRKKKAPEVTPCHQTKLQISQTYDFFFLTMV